MQIKKTISIGALALSFSFAGLALGATGCASNSAAKAPPAMVEKGDSHKCGAGQCGAEMKKKKKAVSKKGQTKGADKKCGASSCGASSCG